MVNAFAVGIRERAAIALTDGLLRTLDSRETVGVLAHARRIERRPRWHVTGLWH